MAIKTVPLSRLESDLKKTLDECADSGETVVVELPDHRLLAIQSLDPNGDDSLIDELLETNPRFQSLVAKSVASYREPFQSKTRGKPTAEVANMDTFPLRHATIDHVLRVFGNDPAITSRLAWWLLHGHSCERWMQFEWAYRLADHLRDQYFVGCEHNRVDVAMFASSAPNWPLWSNRPASLAAALAGAAEIYRCDKAAYGKILANLSAKAQSFSWQRAYAGYRQLYHLATNS